MSNTYGSRVLTLVRRTALIKPEMDEDQHIATLVTLSFDREMLERMRCDIINAMLEGRLQAANLQR